MLSSLRRTIERYRLFFPGDRVLVALSGGPDSVALLHCLWRLREELQIEMIVAHLNHALRGEEADKDAVFVKELAGRLGLEVVIGRENIRELLGKGGSLETVAREVRYRFLYRVAKENSCNKIALGHHADDQSETVLANFIHGTGLKGLGGMIPLNGILVRPLLEVRRCQIKLYLLQEGLPWREDATNRETTYQRNRLRHEIIPFLEQFNPRFQSSLAQMATIVRAEEKFLQEIVEKLFQKIACTTEERVTLDLAALKEQAIALRRRLLRRAYIELAGTTRELSFSHVERLIQLVQDSVGKISLPRGVETVVQERDLIFSRAESVAVETQAFALELRIPGQIVIPGNGCLSAEVQEKPYRLQDTPDNEAYLDMKLLVNPLLVRNRRAGDFFFPLGLKGRKKLKDFFIDLGVERVKRDTVPLVVSSGQIAWVAGFRLDERFKVTLRTQQVLHLRYVRDNN